MYFMVFSSSWIILHLPLSTVFRFLKNETFLFIPNTRCLLIHLSYNNDKHSFMIAHYQLSHTNHFVLIILPKIITALVVSTKQILKKQYQKKLNTLPKDVGIQPLYVYYVSLEQFILLNFYLTLMLGSLRRQGTHSELILDVEDLF